MKEVNNLSKIYLMKPAQYIRAGFLFIFDK